MLVCRILAMPLLAYGRDGEVNDIVRTNCHIICCQVDQWHLRLTYGWQRCGGIPGLHRQVNSRPAVSLLLVLGLSGFDGRGSTLDAVKCERSKRIWSTEALALTVVDEAVILLSWGPG